MNTVIEKKEIFKANLCDSVSILKLGYMYKVLQIIYPGKANLLGAAAFEYKVKKIERLKNTGKAKLMKGMSAMVSGGGSQDYNESSALNQLGKDNSQIDDPLLKNLDTFISEVKEKINEKGKAKLK